MLDDNKVNKMQDHVKQGNVMHFYQNTRNCNSCHSNHNFCPTISISNEVQSFLIITGMPNLITLAFF